MQPETTPEFTTERLRLRAWGLDDLDFIVAMDMDPDVGRYLYPNGRPTIQERTVVTRQRLTSGWPKEGGMWFVEWKDNGAATSGKGTY
jgi:RimJ/RimL family protein N-acetyltransferase